MNTNNKLPLIPRRESSRESISRFSFSLFEPKKPKEHPIRFLQPSREKRSGSMETYNGPVGNEAKLEFYDTFMNLSSFSQRNRVERLEDTPNIAYLEEIHRQKLCPEPFGIVRRRGPTNLIDIRNYGMGDDYAKAFSEAIGTVKDVQILNLKANRLSDIGVANIINKLGSNIKGVVLSDNKLASKSVVSLSVILAGVDCQIKILELENIHMSEKDIGNLCKALLDNKTVTKLSLAKNGIGEGCGLMLKDLVLFNSTIKYLDLHWNALGKGGFLDFCEGLSKNESIKHLDLSWNYLGKGCWSENAKVLSRAISEQQSLQHLDISHNYFNQKECEVLAEGLYGNKTIYGIHVQGNDCKMDPYGFLIPLEYTDKTEQAHLHTRILDTPRFKPNKVSRINCWICEHWVEVTINWGENSNNNYVDPPLFVHFECDEYRPTPAEKINDSSYTLTRMLPSGLIRFFFRSTVYILLSKEYKIQELEIPIRYEFDSTDNTHPLVLVKAVNVINAKPREWDFKSLRVKPRTKLSVNETTDVVLDKLTWDFNSSSFIGYRFDTEEVLHKCCEYDISVSHIKDFVKDPEELKEVVKILEINYKTITEGFRYLSGLSGIELFAINRNILGDFLKKCNVLGPDYSLNDIGVLWSMSNAPQSKGESFNAGNGLCRYEFAEFLVRLAIDKFFKPKQVKSVSESLELLLHQYIIPVVKTFDSYSWRSKFYLVEDVDCVLKAYKPIIECVFNKYSMLGTGSLTKMNLKEFRIFCADAGVLTGTFVIRDIDWCFRQAMMTEIDEILEGEHLEMIYVEFIEALSRVADMAFSEKFASLDKRLEAIMPKLISLCPEIVRKEFEVPSEEMYINMKFKKKAVKREEIKRIN